MALSEYITGSSKQKSTNGLNVGLRLCWSSTVEDEVFKGCEWIEGARSLPPVAVDNGFGGGGGGGGRTYKAADEGMVASADCVCCSIRVLSILRTRKPVRALSAAMRK